MMDFNKIVPKFNHEGIEGLTIQEISSFLLGHCNDKRNAHAKLKAFQKFMSHQTVGIMKDGTHIYYAHDFARFMNMNGLPVID